MAKAILMGLILGATVAGPIRAQAVAVTGIHANEEFCKIIIKQVELFGQFMKLDPMNPDRTKRAKNFADQKELNAKLVKAAPASLASDIVRFVKDANALIDAQLSGNPASIKAATGPLTSPEHRAAAKRMNEYCGVKITASP